MEFVHAIEKALHKKGKIVYKPMKPGDVPSTYANVSSLFDYIGFKPETTVEEGIEAFVAFYKEYHAKQVLITSILLRNTFMKRMFKIYNLHFEKNVDRSQ